MNDLIANIEKLHTTEMGIERIKRNLCLYTNDVVTWCKRQITASNCSITRNGKNWYAAINNSIITVNAHSYTIITAHKTKNNKATGV